MAGKRRRSTKADAPKPQNHEGYHHARKTVFTWTLVIALTLIGGAILSELELENEKDGVREHRGNFEHVRARAFRRARGALSSPLDVTRDHRAPATRISLQLGRTSDPQVK